MAPAALDTLLPFSNLSGQNPLESLVKMGTLQAHEPRKANRTILLADTSFPHLLDLRISAP